MAPTMIFGSSATTNYNYTDPIGTTISRLSNHGIMSPAPKTTHIAKIARSKYIPFRQPNKYGKK